MDLIFSCLSLGLSIRIQEKPLIFCVGVLFGGVWGGFGFGGFLCWFLFGGGAFFVFVCFIWWLLFVFCVLVFCFGLVLMNTLITLYRKSC